MMNRWGMASFALLGLAAAPSGAEPPHPLDPALAAKATEAFPGAKPEGPILSSSGRSAQWGVNLKAGNCYGAAVVGGGGVRTLMVKLSSGGGDTIDHDTTLRPSATVHGCVDRTGQYLLSANVTIGKGELRARVYRLPAARPAPAAAPVAQAAPRSARARERDERREAREDRRERARDREERHDRVAERADRVGQAANNVGNALSMLPSVSVQTSSERHEGPAAASADSSGGGGDACDGDFELGSTSYFDSGAHIGDECNSYRNPTNCPTGVYIHLGHPRRCVCVVRCEEYGSRPAPGNACTQDGSWVCEHYQSKVGRAHAELCAPREWNLCHR
jgi:hypothetical protein